MFSFVFCVFLSGLSDGDESETESGRSRKRCRYIDDEAAEGSESESTSDSDEGADTRNRKTGSRFFCSLLLRALLSFILVFLCSAQAADA